MENGSKPLHQGKKNTILFAAIVAVFILFFLLPANRKWLHTIVTDLHDISSESKNLSTEYRMRYRFRSEYIYSKQIADLLRRKGSVKNALVVIPPTEYFKQHHITYHVPEPVVFYYFTGVKSLWPDCSNASDANWVVKVVDGKIVIDSVIDKEALFDTIAALKKYKISL